MAKAQDLIHILATKARFEAVDVDEKPAQIRILGRVRTDSLPGAMDNWLSMMLAIAQREEQGATWKIDISRKYFPRNGRLIFAWRLIIQGSDLSSDLAEIIQAAQGTSIQVNRELDEIPLPGNAGGDRNAMKNGKGAGLSGRVLAGPAAIAQYNRGGS